MIVRCYPEGDGEKALRVSVPRTPAPGARDAALGSPAWTDAVLLKVAHAYAVAEGAEGGYEPFRLCVEPLDDEARALPGWHPAEEPTPFDGEPPRPFRLFVVSAHVEVEWTAREVQTFNPHTKVANRERASHDEARAEIERLRAAPGMVPADDSPAEPGALACRCIPQYSERTAPSDVGCFLCGKQIPEGSMAVFEVYESQGSGRFGTWRHAACVAPDIAWSFARFVAESTKGFQGHAPFCERSMGSRPSGACNVGRDR